MFCDTVLSWTFGTPEIVVIAVVGLLVFGNRLPEVGKSLGKGIIEFKKGLRGIQDEIDQGGKDSGKNDKQSDR